MKWYSPYIPFFGKSPATLPPALKEEIRYKLQAFQAEKPLVSAVVIAHNEEKHLWSCLWSLSENRCTFPVEILGIDNLSTDQTPEIFRESGIRWYSESRKGPGHARQCGLEQARGTYYLCLDADTLYPPHYLETMIRYLRQEGTAGVYGRWSFMPDRKHSRVGLWFYERLRDIHLRLQSLKRPELCVRGMVFGFRTAPGRECGFRTDIRRGEDGSMALALKKYGRLRFVSSRKARVITSTTTLNADGSLWDSLQVRMKKQLKGLTSYFTPKTDYQDEESNLI